MAAVARSCSHRIPPGAEIIDICESSSEEEASAIPEDFGDGNAQPADKEKLFMGGARVCGERRVEVCEGWWRVRVERGEAARVGWYTLDT